MTDTTPEAAQLSLDRFCAGPADQRARHSTTVAALADTEPLLALPAMAYPATITASRTVADNATVAFRGNRYSVGPGLIGVDVEVRHRLGGATVEVVAAGGQTLASHRLAPSGAGQIVRTPAHHAALEQVVLSAFTTQRPCDPKGNHPPGPTALAAAQALLGAAGRDVVVDLAAYAEVTGGGRS